MRLSVHHATRFEFDQPSGHSIHDVRLTPKPASGQRLISWRIDGPGKRSEWLDGHGNQVTTFSVAQQHDRVEIVVHGIYEYIGGDQWLRYAETPTLPAPFWLRNTGLARHDASFDPLVDGLAERAKDPAVREIILALNATVDGQTTAHYIADALAGTGVALSGLAQGVPIGGELDYLDEGTLAAAIKARRML